MLQCTQQGDALTVHLCGEIDHCAAEGLRNEIEMQIVRQNAKRLILDFSQVTFMDSSGIANHPTTNVEITLTFRKQFHLAFSADSISLGFIITDNTCFFTCIL